MSTTNCAICQRQSSDDRFVVFQNDLWTIRHSRETNILGYLLIESRRHILDLSLADQRECTSYGLILRAAIAAVKSAVDPERVYTISLAEAVPHFHVHVIPRTQATPRAYRGRGILAYPLEPCADEALVQNVCSRISRRLRASLALNQPGVRQGAIID